MVWRQLYRTRLPVNWEGFRRDHHRTRPAHRGHTGVRESTSASKPMTEQHGFLRQEETSVLGAGRGNIRRGATVGHMTVTNKASYQC